MPLTSQTYSYYGNLPIKEMFQHFGKIELSAPVILKLGDTSQSISSTNTEKMKIRGLSLKPHNSERLSGHVAT